MKFNLKIIESNKEISDMIKNALKIEIQNIINKAMPSIKKDIMVLVAEALRNEPEYSSLIGGTLRAEFGIAQVSDVEKVIDAMVNTINIEQENITASLKGLKGGFKLTMLGSEDMSGIIYQDIASVIDTQRGYSLPWLEWLLYENNNIIVNKYYVKYTSSPYSRSGMAIMAPSDSNWRVPPEFAGSIRNNWTTRAISTIEDRIYNTIIKNIENLL